MGKYKDTRGQRNISKARKRKRRAKQDALEESEPLAGSEQGGPHDLVPGLQQAAAQRKAKPAPAPAPAPARGGGHAGRIARRAAGNVSPRGPASPAAPVAAGARGKQGNPRSVQGAPIPQGGHAGRIASQRAMPAAKPPEGDDYLTQLMSLLGAAGHSSRPTTGASPITRRSGGSIPGVGKALRGYGRARKG